MGDADGKGSSDTLTRVEPMSLRPDPDDGPGPSEASIQEVVSRRVRERLFGGPIAAETIGRYTVIDVVGEGGMGTVLRAFDPQLDRQVAIKVLQTQLSHQDEMRLRREAVAMAKLSHPNVVQVYEVGDSDGRIFVAMELVSGQTLREWMEQRHGWRECVELFIGLGEGLAAAHESGLVHRDFKPGNALIDTKGRPRVLDFGLARQAQADDGDEADAPLAKIRRALVVEDAVVANTPLTKTGTVMGTPAYMSPEQFHGVAVDARSDQFSFCATLYEALYGERPFGMGQLYAVMGRILRNKVLPAPAGHGVPRALRKILLRGMAAAPASRWSSMDELLSELRELLAPKRQRWITAGLVVALLATSGGLIASRLGAEAEPVGVDGDAPGTGTETGALVDANNGSSSEQRSDGAFVEECPDDPALALCMGFESVEGKVVRDDIDPRIRGVLAGDATIGEGLLGNALIMPGKDGRLVLDTAIDPPGSFSIDGWIWMATDSPVWAGIVDKWVQFRGYWFGGTSRIGGLAFWVDGVSISTEEVPKEQWIHVAGTFDVDSGVMSLYIDGGLVALGQHAGPATPADQSPLALGYAVLDKTPFRGRIDAIRLWNRVLTEEEIRRCAPPRSASSPVE